MLYIAINTAFERVFYKLKKQNLPTVVEYKCYTQPLPHNYSKGITAF